MKDGSLPFHHHAQPPEGCLLNPRPLDAQFVERLLIVRRELFFLDLSAVRIHVAHNQVRQVPVTATSPLICAASRNNCGINSRPCPSISTICP